MRLVAVWLINALALIAVAMVASVCLAREVAPLDGPDAARSASDDGAPDPGTLVVPTPYEAPDHHRDTWTRTQRRTERQEVRVP